MCFLFNLSFLLLVDCGHFPFLLAAEQSFPPSRPKFVRVTFGGRVSPLCNPGYDEVPAFFIYALLLSLLAPASPPVRRQVSFMGRIHGRETSYVIGNSGF